MTLTLSAESRSMLRRASNSSEYVDRLIRQFPPPSIETLDDLAALVRDGHPYVTSPYSGTDPRTDLPRFGGAPPERLPGAYSWDPERIMDGEGELHLRTEWESWP